MTNSAELQTAYNKFYANIRNYIWDFKTVESLAELEIGIYKRFPNIEDVKKSLDKLGVKISKTMQDDEDFKRSFEKLKNLLSDTDSKNVYTTLRDINIVKNPDSENN